MCWDVFWKVRGLPGTTLATRSDIPANVLPISPLLGTIGGGLRAPVGDIFATLSPPISRNVYIYIYMSSCAAAQVPPPRRGIHVVVFFLSLGGFPLGYEGPVLCLLKRLTKRKKYRAECPRFFVFEFGSKSEYPYSAKIPPNFGGFSRRCSVYLGGVPPIKVDFVAILAQIGSIWDAKGLPNAIYRQITTQK